MKKNVGLLYGGKSSEHEVSIRSAFSIMKAIDYNKYNVVPIYINLEGEWLKGETLEQSPKAEESLRFLSSLPFDIFKLKKEVDVVFPVLHGPNGEDGTLQGMLEMLDVPYVGCGVIGSSVGMDKVLMKTLFSTVGLPQCHYLSFTRKDLENHLSETLDSVETEINYPIFVKPANLGSSVGISKVYNREELSVALLFASQFDRKVIVESFVKGRELEIGVLGNEELLTSEVGEVSTSADFYDYEAKYKNETVTKIQIPADIPQEVKNRISYLAKESFKVLECWGLSRVDFFWNEDTNEIYINEINTLPGFTPVSMYPMLFKEVGVGYAELVERLLELGVERYQEVGS